MDFTAFGLKETLIEGISAMGYQQATPVQEKVIPVILEGKDLIASAQTGTGKTAAFLLPVVHQLISHPHDAHQINALVIVPTRELAIQISQTMEGLAYFTSTSAIAVYGGGEGTLFTQEKKALSLGADMVICTPGRMLAHLAMGYVKLDGLKYLILDEADRMLDMGFYDDIMKIISYLPKQRQTLLFSATMPSRIRQLAQKILHTPEEINIAISRPPEKIQQSAFSVYEEQKAPLLKWLLTKKNFGRILIFCSRINNVRSLTRVLKHEGFSANEIHSGLEQGTRERVLLDFKNRKLNILVATDILSRGIDIDDIDLVINYDVPHGGEDYVHRIGRTARAASEGMAITFITPIEQRKFLVIERLLGYAVPKEHVPEVFGPAPIYNPISKKIPGSKKPYKKRKVPHGGKRHGT